MKLIIEDRELVRLRRIAEQRLEVEFVPQYERLGANCPAGTLFFLPVGVNAVALSLLTPLRDRADPNAAIQVPDIEVPME